MFTPLDTVVRSACGYVADAPPVIIVPLVAVLTAELYDTIAATLIADAVSAVPAVTL